MSLPYPYRSAALEQQALVKETSGAIRQVIMHNTNAATRFLHIYDLGRAVTAAVSGVAEVNTIDFGGIAGADLAGEYFTFYGPNGLVKVWFNVDDGDTEPTLDAATTVEVALEAADDANAIAAAVDAVLDVYNTAWWTTSVTTDTVTITQASTGVRQNISAGTSGAVVATTAQGVDAIASPLLSLFAPIPVEADQTVSISFEGGLPVRNGIVVANSSTAETYTAGSADSWFTVLYS